MDTKLKRISASKGAFAILTIVEAISLFIVGVAGALYAALKEMAWITGFDNQQENHDVIFDYFGTISNMQQFEHIQNFIVVGGVIAMIVSAILIVLLVVMVGRDRAKNSSIELSWFDRIWFEVQAIALACAGGLISASVLMLYDSWMRGAYFSIWNITKTSDNIYGQITPEAMLITGLVLLFAGVYLSLVLFLSFVKKIKAREFWRRSLIGQFILYLKKLFDESDKTTVKIILVLIGCALLSATWFGLIIVAALAIIFVPKFINKFNGIKKGVDEVRNGNLNYKIPIEIEDNKGKTELDRLAEGINDISFASNKAIQNEIKNQRMKTELISNVSHDIKTPLTSMISYVDLLKTEGLDSPSAPEYLDIVEQKTQRLKELTENLFDAAKASSGAMPVELVNLDINALLTQSLVEFEDKFKDKGLEVQIQNNCNNAEARIQADGKLLHRVIENVLGNISKYAMPYSRVYIDISDFSISSEQDKGMIRLEIKNISKDALNISANELMERFKRGDDSRNTEGSGLGLAIAKDLTKLMDGVFEVAIDGDLFKVTVLMNKAEK